MNLRFFFNLIRTVSNFIQGLKDIGKYLQDANATKVDLGELEEVERSQRKQKCWIPSEGCPSWRQRRHGKDHVELWWHLQDCVHSSHVQAGLLSLKMSYSLNGAWESLLSEVLSSHSPAPSSPDPCFVFPIPSLTLGSQRHLQGSTLRWRQEASAALWAVSIGPTAVTGHPLNSPHTSEEG